MRFYSKLIEAIGVFLWYACNGIGCLLIGIGEALARIGDTIEVKTESR